MKSKNEKQFTKEAVHQDLDPVLCKRNLALNDFYMLLSGKVTICSGKDQLLTDMKQFEWFGEKALSVEEYIPDFSAKVISHATLLKISKQDYISVISDKRNMRK